MKAAALVFPRQLFADNPCLKQARIVSLVEDQWFFRDHFSVTKGIKTYPLIWENRGYNRKNETSHL